MGIAGSTWNLRNNFGNGREKNYDLTSLSKTLFFFGMPNMTVSSNIIEL